MAHTAAGLGTSTVLIDAQLHMLHVGGMATACTCTIQLWRPVPDSPSLRKVPPPPPPIAGNPSTIHSTVLALLVIYAFFGHSHVLYPPPPPDYALS